MIPNKVLKFKNSNFKKYTKIYGIFSVGGDEKVPSSGRRQGERERSRPRTWRLTLKRRPDGVS
jgi:hypothetical protein